MTGWRKSWDDIMSRGRAVGRRHRVEIQAFEDQTGLGIPDDLETVLGDNVHVRGRPERADGGRPRAPVTRRQLNLGARFTGDKDKINAIYDKVAELIEQEAGSSLPL